MGTLVYSDSMQWKVEDQTLAELRFVMFEKLRRQESFAITLQQALVDADAVRSFSAWVTPETPLVFVFDGAVPKESDRERVETLMRMTYTRAGVVLEVDPHD